MQRQREVRTGEELRRPAVGEAQPATARAGRIAVEDQMPARQPAKRRGRRLAVPLDHEQHVLLVAVLGIEPVADESDRPPTELETVELTRARRARAPGVQ